MSVISLRQRSDANRLKSTIWFAVVALAIAVASPSTVRANVIECVVKSEGAPIRVTDVKTGKFVKELRAGDFVYERWLQFLPHTLSILDAGRFREIQGPTKETLDCHSAGSSPEYPIVFREAKALRDAFGLQYIDLVDDPGAAVANPLVCNFKVLAHTSEIHMTPAFFERYKKAKIPLRQLCMVLLSGQVRFNPETGERLPTFVVLSEQVDEKGEKSFLASDELPLMVPECFGKGKMSRPQSFVSQMEPVGCTVNYHPWSGRKLSTTERDVFTRRLILMTSSESGEMQEDSLNLARDDRRRPNDSKIEAIKARLGKQ